MFKEEKKFWILGFILFGLFVAFTVALKFVDVQPIGPNGSSVGFATINGRFRDIVGTDYRSYLFSEYLGFCSFIVVGAAAIQGLGQWISRRSIRGVKPHVLLFGLSLLLLLFFYCFFEIFPINYRPILEDGQLAASYPSSHTLLAVFVFIAGAYELSFSVRTKDACVFLSACFSLLALVTVITRTFSGYHWLTDIIGGILLAVSLIMFYVASVIHFVTREKE